MNQNANATQQQKDFSDNDVRFQGYLKSSKLALRKTQQGTDYIGGDILIAMSADQSIAIRCFAYKYSNTKDGEPASINANFERLAKFLPTGGDSSVVSIAAIAAKNPDLTLEQAMVQATKVYGYGSLEENAFIAKDGTEVSRIRIKASFIDVSNLTTGFVPYNKFSVKMYVGGVHEDPNTNRLQLGGYFLSYKGVANQIIVITPDEHDTTVLANGKTVGSFAKFAHDYIKAQYVGGTTVVVTGYISDTRIVKAPEVTVSDNPFLMAGASTAAVSTFVHENIVYGGLAPIADGADGSISKTEIRKGLTLREAQFGPRPAHVAVPTPTPVPAPVAKPASVPTPTPTTQPGFGGFGFNGTGTTIVPAAPTPAPVSAPAPSAAAPDVASVIGHFAF